MRRTELLQEIRKMKFESIYNEWTQEEAALILGVCAKTFRRQINRFNESGIDTKLYCYR